MTDENVNPKTFDLVSALMGRTYPTEVITVFFDEALQYEYQKRLSELTHNDKGESKKRVDELLEKFKTLAIKVHLRGVDREAREGVKKQAREAHPPTTNSFGLEEFTPEFTEMEENLTWVLHVEKIVSPDGSVLQGMTVEEAALFRAKAPDAAINAVVEGINSLSKGAKSGYQSAVQDLDFLSRPSQEG